MNLDSSVDEEDDFKPSAKVKVHEESPNAEDFLKINKSHAAKHLSAEKSEKDTIEVSAENIGSKRVKFNQVIE
jgi:hypothetical protein